MGAATDEDRIVSIFLAALATGMYLVTLFYSLHWLLYSGEGWRPRKQMRWAILSATLVLFVLSSLHTGLAVHYTLGLLGQSDDAPRPSRLAWGSLTMCTAANTTALISDAFLIYRCWVVCSKSRKIIIFPSFFWVGGVVCTVLQLYWQIIQTTGINSWVPLNMTIGPGTILTPFWASTVIVNIYATGFIVYRIWKTAKESKHSTSIRELNFAMRVLLESGALYLVIAVPHFIVWWTEDGAAIFIISWSNLPVICSAFNLIVIRTSQHREEDTQNTEPGPISVMQFNGRASLEFATKTMADISGATVDSESFTGSSRIV
ncbi:hypothetical protein BDZ97DRAFT_2075827 [Flammula alnicola]|nr:hypothetical protein BDZ97DRAFT_2075827 [Flammula alnicola]